MEKEKFTTTNPYYPKKTTSGNKKSNESLSGKVGDSIERLGEKVMKAGAEKLGRAIYNAGNKIEHMNDEKNPTHH